MSNHSILRFLSLLLGCLASLAAADLPAAVDDPSRVRALVAGATLPAATVATAEGEVPLNEAVGDGKVALVVYRGGWCPVCTRHFAALGSVADELQEDGWRLVALSPDSRESIAAWEEKHSEDAFTRLSDSDVDAIRALGLAFVVDAATRETYKGYGIDLQAASGHDHHTLPVPTVILVVDGTARFVHADADYQRRLTPEVLRAAVAMVEKQSEAAKQ